MNGQLCPDCATPLNADGGTACGCAERAAQSVRTERSEEIAVAEDFDPLRIRPYVTLERGEVETHPAVFRTAGPLPPLSPGDGQDSAPRPAAELELYRGHRRRPARRKPFIKVVAVGAAVVAVIGTAAFAGGVFSGGDQPDESLADETQADLPTTSYAEPDTSHTSPAPSRSPFVSADPTATASTPRSTATEQPTPPTATATASAATASAATTPPPTPSGAPTGQPTKETETPPPHTPDAGPSLKAGDTGSGVVDLQHRLAALWLYHGQADGRYDQDVEYSVRIYQQFRHISGDPGGVYGPNTRHALESEENSQGPGNGHHGRGH